MDTAIELSPKPKRRGRPWPQTPLVERLPDDTESSFMLRRAIQWATSQAALAKMAGVSQTAIWSALRYRRVSAELCVAIERGTGGKFRRQDFRPDLFLEAAE